MRLWKKALSALLMLSIASLQSQSLSSAAVQKARSVSIRDGSVTLPKASSEGTADPATGDLLTLGAVNFVVDPSPKYVYTDEEFYVDITIAATHDDCYTAAVAYVQVNPAYLRLLRVSQYGYLDAVAPDNYVDGNTGRLKYGASYSNPGSPCGTGGFFRLWMRALQPSRGEPVQFVSGTDILLYGNSVLGSSTDGQIVIRSGPSPTPTVTPTARALGSWDIALVGYFDTSGWAHSVAVAGSYAYVADFDKGLRVIDVSNPAVPVEVGYYDPLWYAFGVAVAGGYAYVVDEYGLRVIECVESGCACGGGFLRHPVLGQ